MSAQNVTTESPKKLTNLQRLVHKLKETHCDLGSDGKEIFIIKNIFN